MMFYGFMYGLYCLYIRDYFLLQVYVRKRWYHTSIDLPQERGVHFKHLLLQDSVLRTF